MRIQIRSAGAGVRRRRCFVGLGTSSRHQPESETLAFILSQWLAWGDVRPVLSWGAARPRVALFLGTYFGALAMQLVLATTGDKGMAFCAECGRPFKRVSMVCQRLLTAKQSPGYLAVWLEASRSTVRPRTWSRYEQYVRIHAVPVIGRVPLSRLAPQDLQRLNADRLRSGSAPLTVAHLHAVLHRAFSQAERWGVVPRNIATRR